MHVFLMTIYIWISLNEHVLPQLANVLSDAVAKKWIVSKKKKNVSKHDSEGRKAECCEIM